MADKKISELVPADVVRPPDLFPMEQDGAAKKVSGQVMINYLTAAADGHGGIKSIRLHTTVGLVKTYRITLADDTVFDMPVADGNGVKAFSKIGTSGLTNTYRIDLADGTHFDFAVKDGKGIVGVTKSGPVGLVNTYTMKFNEGDDFVFEVTNGAKGDKGDADRLYFKFASQKPTDASHSMGDVPDEWLGFYAGTTAPTGWQDYTWVRVRGDKGDKGDPATLTGHSITYMVSDSGTIVPSGSWVADVPSVPQGKYLWTRTVLNFNTGNPVTSYSVSRFGLDGTGAVNAVNSQEPDSTGNVKVTAENIQASDGRSVQAALDEAAGAVKTVNGKEPDGAGAVTLGAEDVGARPDTWVPTAADVGAVAKSDVLTAEEIEASTDLTGKVAGADAVKSTLSALKKLPNFLFIDGSQNLESSLNGCDAGVVFATFSGSDYDGKRPGGSNLLEYGVAIAVNRYGTYTGLMFYGSVYAFRSKDGKIDFN